MYADDQMQNVNHNYIIVIQPLLRESSSPNNSSIFSSPSSSRHFGSIVSIIPYMYCFVSRAHFPEGSSAMSNTTSHVL